MPPELATLPPSPRRVPSKPSPPDHLPLENLPEWPGAIGMDKLAELVERDQRNKGGNPAIRRPMSLREHMGERAPGRRRIHATKARNETNQANPSAKEGMATQRHRQHCFMETRAILLTGKSAVRAFATSAKLPVGSQSFMPLIGRRPMMCTSQMYSFIAMRFTPSCALHGSLQESNWPRFA